MREGAQEDTYNDTLDVATDKAHNRDGHTDVKGDRGWRGKITNL